MKVQILVRYFRCSVTLLMSVLFLTALADIVPQGDNNQRDCPMVKIKVERLPDLNIPRNSHSAVCLNGELTVFGGHTTNFIPTQTAEYYKDGRWHLMQMAYTHDNGLCVVLKSGKVLLGGGHAESMGIGQTYPVEEYDPVTHTFRGFCILSKKRTFASGAELDSGRVVVSGNWYADDGIEMFDGDRTFSPVKDVATPRSVPYMLRTSDGDVMILGNEGQHGKPICSDLVERMKGAPFRVPILNKWQPITFEAPFPNDLGFIGDESKGDYVYLLAVQDWSGKDTIAWNLFGRKTAFVMVCDTTFSMLPTTCDVPQTGFSTSDSILWYSPLIADRKAHKGYVHGSDLQGRSYVLCVEYDKMPAPLTIYYTDPLPDAGSPMIALTDEGDLVMVGGYNFNKKQGGQLGNDNFSPLSTVYLLHVGTQAADASGSSTVDWFWWIGLALILAAMAVLILLVRKRRHHAEAETEIETQVTDSAPHDELMQRICKLMEEQQLYLNSDLKLGDVADALNTNRNVISACINNQRGCSFSQFISGYRIDYAKDLMRRQPDVKVSEVWMASGFSTETSFFRTFKNVTGMTPSEFKQKFN